MERDPRYLIIPAAGLGTRMRSVAPRTPKEMLAIGRKPAILYAVEEGCAAGISDVIIVINSAKEIIRQYFSDRRTRTELFPQSVGEAEEVVRTCSFTFLYQQQPSGESDAIGLARAVTGNHSLAIIYPDNIYFPAPGALKALTSVYRSYGKDTSALMKVTRANAAGIGNSGKVDLVRIRNNLFRIERFYPKGTGQFSRRFQGELRTCGITVSGPHIFDYIERARTMVRHKEFTDVSVRVLMLREREILGCLLPGTVFDIGNPVGYRLCLRHVSEGDRPRNGAEIGPVP